jgi:hypothetical protein
MFFDNSLGQKHKHVLRGLMRLTSAFEGILPSWCHGDIARVVVGIAANEPCKMSDLAHWLKMPRTSVSRYCNELCDRGFTELVEDPGDKRTKNYKLTVQAIQAMQWVAFVASKTAEEMIGLREPLPVDLNADGTVMTYKQWQEATQDSQSPGIEAKGKQPERKSKRANS